MKRLEIIKFFKKKSLIFLLFIGVAFAANGQAANVDDTGNDFSISNINNYKL